MSNELDIKEEHYISLYGKLFSGLLNQFGVQYVVEIEDAIQNSLFKLLKIKKEKESPNHQEHWLFIVARNDVLNQIKKKKTQVSFSLEHADDSQCISHNTDLRLQTMLFVANLKHVSSQAKIIFVLKHIFGLGIAEIADSVLMNKEAVYKSINRTKQHIQNEYRHVEIDLSSMPVSQHAISIVEEVLYAVFNVGFDSFNGEHTATIVNKELCLEALALTKLLFSQYHLDSTSNLLSLFCFHIARIPAKVDNGKLIPFFEQNREKWSSDLVGLGFRYLKKPKNISKFYLEAVIISKYMTLHELTIRDWSDIVKLYDMMQQVSRSPIIMLNYCFCLSRIGRTEEALNILSEIEKKLPHEHLYFSLVKATVMREINRDESDALFTSVMNGMPQNIRKAYLLETRLT